MLTLGGSIMSRSVKGSKGCGYEYWSKRPMCYSSPGRWAKQKCHRIERQQDKDLIRAELKDCHDL
jgi:hypothetical protein